jgi:GR25 family glycosyltransferase involved in LPS biosynthesis
MNGRIGCLKSHLAALKLATPAPGEHVLLLEDDFCFSSDLETHLDDLATFCERSYDYVACLLAASKYGRILPRDDLVSESHQPCTNATAYLVSGDHADRLSELRRQALTRLLETHEQYRYATDRYWTLLGPEGMLLVFRRKLGFQAASFSDIESRVFRKLD